MSPRPEGRFDRSSVFFASNYFALGMLGIVYEPLAYLLKDGLGLGAGQSAAFAFWMTLPFLVKPLFAAASELWPGAAAARRRPQVIACALLALAAWLALAALPGYRYGPLLALMIAANTGLISADVIGNGVMVKRGKALGKTGIYQAVELSALYGAIVISGMGGGWLAGNVGARSVFLMAALLTAPVAASAFLLEEEPAKAPPSASSNLSALRGFLKSGGFASAAMVLFLWSFSPHLGAPQFYYQTQALGLSPAFIGLLNAIDGASGLAGALFYGRVVGRAWEARKIARAAIYLGVLLNLSYALYRGPGSALLVTALAGFGTVALRLSLMDLAAQICPAGAEATAFALLMTAVDLAESGSNALGGRLYAALSAALSPYGAWLALAALGAAATLACLYFLPGLAARKSEPASQE